MARTVFKPAGIPVFPPHGAPDGDCLLRRLNLPNTHAWPIGFEGGLAHRLDTATSGAMLVAEDPDELLQLRRWFSEGRLLKRYGMEAARDVPWHHHRCDQPIAHDSKHRNRMIVQRGGATPHRGQWYPAHTAFDRHDGQQWRVTITTGVMHQIRAHAAFVGLPLRGDRHYGGGAAISASVPFHLHCFELRGPDGFVTDPVPAPPWWTG
jgi:23S rRNA-/tRNA-specific pseudouridylate synthase